MACDDGGRRGCKCGLSDVSIAEARGTTGTVGVGAGVATSLAVQGDLGGRYNLRSGMGMAPTMGGMGSTLAHQAQQGCVATSTSSTTENGVHTGPSGAARVDSQLPLRRSTSVSPHYWSCSDTRQSPPTHDPFPT